MGSRFEIRKTIKNYRSHSLGKPEPEDEYDQIDLMAYLLRGILYKDLYDKPLHWLLTTMIGRLDSNFPVELGQPGIVQKVVGELRGMETYALANPALTLKDLYLNVYPAGDPVTDHIVVPYRRLLRLSGNRLCLPFLPIQDGTHAPIDPVAMSQHIQDVSSFNYQQFYTMSKVANPGLATAIARDRGLGILNFPDDYRLPDGGDEKGSTIMAPQGGGGGNYRECGPQGCQDTQNNTFCNVAGDGTCSTVSGN